MRVTKMVYSGGPYVGIGSLIPKTEMVLGNIIVNGGFETGVVTPWVDNSNCFTHLVDTDNPHNGTYSFHWLGVHNSTPCFDYISLHQTILGLLVSGSDMSFWVYEDNENTYGDGCTWVYVTITFSSGKHLHYLLWKYESGVPPVGNPCAEDANNGTFDLHNLAAGVWVEVSRNLHADYTTKFGAPSGVNIIKISVCSWNQNSNYEMHFDDAAIFGDVEKATPIGPINIPYSRVSDGIELIAENTITASFIPYEWWFNYAGSFYFAETRGTDKSASVHLVAGDHIAGSVKEQVTKQTSQRVRVVGRGETAEQDNNTSDWQEDTDEMDNINGFYEKIESEKSLSSKDESDTWAQVLLALNAPVRNEITIKMENDQYNAGQYDVGDIVTATDPDTGIIGTYRVKTIEKRINNSGGESVSVTLCKRRTDIIDRLSDLFKRMQTLENSSTYLDSMFAEGSRQTKLKDDVVEDIWGQTASNKWATELPEDEAAATQIMESCAWVGRGAIGWGCDKEEFTVYGAAANAAGEVFVFDPLLKFSRDPRFTCEFEIDTDEEGEAWVNGDACWIRINQVHTLCGGGDPTNPNKHCCVPFGTADFGFYLLKTADNYELWATNDDKITYRNVKIANISIDVKYIIEARLEWKEKIVKYYFGKADVDKDDLQWGFRLRAVLPISSIAIDEDNLCPFHILIDSAGGANIQGIVIYRWKTQAIRAVT